MMKRTQFYTTNLGGVGGGSSSRVFETFVHTLIIWLLDGTRMEQVNGLQSGRESRQDVVRIMIIPYAHAPGGHYCLIG